VNLQVDWKEEFQNEIKLALQARDSGNEGMARVCARRAAGIVIGEYLARHGHINISTSAHTRLSLFISLPDVDQSLKVVARHFLIKVNPEHELPIPADLINEAKWLEKSLITGKQG
jgi:hypothetical protein